MVQTVELPKVPGYVEVIGPGGRHVYRNIETGEITENPYERKTAPPTADRDYEPGEYLTADSVLYRVLLPIFAGARITVGTNVEATTIESEIANLNKEES